MSIVRFYRGSLMSLTPKLYVEHRRMGCKGLPFAVVIPVYNGKGFCPFGQIQIDLLPASVVTADFHQLSLLRTGAVKESVGA